MGNSNSQQSSEETVNFQKLDKYFTKELIGSWLKKEKINLEDYLEPLLALYTDGVEIKSSLLLPKDDKFEKHLSNMLDYHVNHILGKPVKNGQSQAFTIPKIIGVSHVLTNMDVAYLQTHLPESSRSIWNVVYNSSINGESWAQFLNALLRCPSRTLIIIQTEERTFGAFMSTPWVSNPGTFVGDSDNFLFSLQNKDSATMIYKPTFFNENYAYLSIHSSSCTNGMGFGGQLDYFGLFLKDDFTGSSFAKPTSTTYGSPQLSANETFKITHLEVVTVEEYDPEEYFIKNPGFQQLFGKKENMEFLELAGIEMYSKSIPPPVHDEPQSE